MLKTGKILFCIFFGLLVVAVFTYNTLAIVGAILCFVLMIALPLTYPFWNSIVDVMERRHGKILDWMIATKTHFFALRRRWKVARP